MSLITNNRIAITIGGLVEGDQPLVPTGVELDVDGNMKFIGTGGFPFGTQCLHEGAVNLDFSTSGQGVYIPITGFTTSLLVNGVTVVSDAFRVGTVGVYRIDWDVSGDSAGTNKDYEIDVFINNVEQPCASARRAFGAIGSLGTMAGHGGFVVTDAAHDIELRMKEVGGAAGSDFDIFNMNFVIQQVGGVPA